MFDGIPARFLLDVRGGVFLIPDQAGFEIRLKAEAAACNGHFTNRASNQPTRDLDGEHAKFEISAVFDDGIEVGPEGFLKRVEEIDTGGKD